MPKYRTDPTRNSRHEADNGDRHENTKYRKDIFFNSKNICLIEIFVFSVVSWSARNESRSTQESSSSWEVVQQQQQLEQHRSMQQHMQVMQQRETQRQVRRTDDGSYATPCCVVQQRESLERKSQERQSRTVERRQPAPAPVQEVSQVQRQEQRQQRVEERQEVGYWISPTLYLLSPIQRQEVRSVIKKTQQETQETKREKVKQEAAVTIPVKNYRYVDNEPALCITYLVSLRAILC